jgi:TIR domain
VTGGIFINYRRQDTIATAGRLFDRLARAFGNKQIFMDVDHIPAGADFFQHIEAELAKCGVLLALIGPNWLQVQDDFGSRRLFDPHDLVANEIGAALGRCIHVIPVLVDGAAMPGLEDVPDMLKPLVRRNAVELRNAQFGADAERLVRRIGELLKKRTAATRRKYVMIVGMLLLAPLIWFASFLIPSGRDSVESCGLIGPIEAGLEFSGVFAGVVVDAGQSGADIQLKLIRDQNSVRGSYFRAGICGGVGGDVVGNRMIFNWNWADSSGRGVATQIGDSLNGSSGFKDAMEGAGTFILFLRKRR